MDKRRRIGYLTGQYARPSDTFIRFEVDELRRGGLEIVTFSIRRPDAGEPPDENVAEHQQQTEYLLEAGAPRLLASFLTCMVVSPASWIRTTLLAWRTRQRGAKGCLKQLAYLIEAAYLVRRIRQLKIDHLHNHIGENSATVAMLAAELAGISYSLTIHGPGIFYAPHTWALGEKLDRAAFTACITDYCRSQCMTFASPETWERLHVVRCGIPRLFLEPPVRRDVVDSVPTFVCVGRLCVEKGQRLLVEVARQLKSESRALKVVIVGDGEDRADLECRIGEAEVGDIVELVGWKTSAEIRELLLTARAFVLPSFAEGLPIVIMESLALECPVISTQVAAIPELVETGLTGWLIPPASPEALSAAFRLALDASPEELRGLGRRGRERVLNRHDPTRQAAELHALLTRS